jgi:hypothetical protein
VARAFRGLRAGEEGGVKPRGRGSAERAAAAAKGGLHPLVHAAREALAA